MANRVIEANYNAMISALYAFASNVYILLSDMQTTTYMCTQALSEEDNAVGEIYPKIKDCTLKYAEATDKAKKVAESMQLELDEMKKEAEIWSSDD